MMRYSIFCHSGKEWAINKNGERVAITPRKLPEELLGELYNWTDWSVVAPHEATLHSSGNKYSKMLFSQTLREGEAGDRKVEMRAKRVVRKLVCRKSG